MKSSVIYLLVISIGFLACSCSEKSDPVSDQESFTSIFDNNQFSASYFPIDIKQTADGGYLVLGERRLQNSNFRGIYLMKADKFGKYVNALEVDELYVNPVPDLMLSGNLYYFFCMNGQTLQTNLVSVNADTVAINV